MKKLNVNEEKFKKVLKAGIALTSATFVLVSFTRCSKQSTPIPVDYPSGYEYINQENNKFEELYTTVIREGKPVKAYNKENISITINKDTFEVKEYIYDEGVISAQIYDLETKYLIAEVSLSDNVISAKKDMINWEIISENTYIVDFKNLEAYIEGETSKNFYTLEEIRELEPKIVESVKLILEYEEGYQKVK